MMFWIIFDGPKFLRTDGWTYEHTLLQKQLCCFERERVLLPMFLLTYMNVVIACLDSSLQSINIGKCLQKHKEVYMYWALILINKDFVFKYFSDIDKRGIKKERQIEKETDVREKDTFCLQRIAISDIFNLSKSTALFQTLGYLYLTVAQNTMHAFEVNQVFDLFKSFVIHRQKAKIKIQFSKIIVVFHKCAMCSELPYNI